MTYISQLAYFDPSNDISTTMPYHMSSSLIIAIYFILLAVMIVAYAVQSWLLGRIFNKAGLPSWIAWVPFYKTWKMLELGNQRGWWAILTIIPFANYVAAVFIYISQYHIGIKLGKEGWWVVLAIFIPIVWLAILAYDKSTWQSELDVPRTPQPPVTPVTTV